ncbi:MAG: prolyl oligopeptidase family serine peptidase, partial [Brevundimonas sp.]
VVVAINDNVVGRLAVFENKGEWGWPRTDIVVPANSAVGLGDSSKAKGQVFVSTQGFLVPPTLSLADVSTGALTELKSAPAKFDASTHVVEQFEATSTDGTKIPYFVTRPKNLAMDGTGPTILFGYGGFQASFPPAYKPEMGKLWLENGGVFVQANIRGGGEFGPGWHQAALRENRQRAFDDFAAVARDLEQRKITSPRHLGIYGRSNGGVLTSVSITQHPELFNAAVIESPLIDMLRYQDLPAGASWIGEYGDPRIPGDAEFIARYSAYQQLRPEVKYPRVYITTNTRDDRVHPGHARKFAARLGDQGHDHLYYEDTAGGHSNDADPVANARRWARHYVYLAQQLMD